MKKKLDLSGYVYNELDRPIGKLANGILSSLNRTSTQDEMIIDKLNVFTQQLKEKESVELDAADFKLFRTLVVQCDAWQIIKSPILKKLDAMKI